MAVYKQPRSKYWWYKFTWRSEQIRESTKQTNKRVAEQMGAAHKTALAKGEVGIREKKPAPTFSALCKRFLKWVAVEKAERPSTVKFYNDMVRNLLRYEPFGNLLIDRIRRFEGINHRCRREGDFHSKYRRRNRIGQSVAPKVHCVSRAPTRSQVEQSISRTFDTAIQIGQTPSARATACSSLGAQANSRLRP